MNIFRYLNSDKVNSIKMIIMSHNNTNTEVI